jgi:hypothetical protein
MAAERQKFLSPCIGWNGTRALEEQKEEIGSESRGGPSKGEVGQPVGMKSHRPRPRPRAGIGEESSALTWRRRWRQEIEPLQGAVVSCSPSTAGAGCTRRDRLGGV